MEDRQLAILRNHRRLPVLFYRPVLTFRSRHYTILFRPVNFPRRKLGETALPKLSEKAEKNGTRDNYNSSHYRWKGAVPQRLEFTE